MPHSQSEEPLVKRQKLQVVHPKQPRDQVHGSVIFAPFRTIGLVNPTRVPFTAIPRGKTTFQITTSVGRCLHTYDLKRGLNLLFVTRPQTPANITAIFAHGDQVYAAWGLPSKGASAAQGIWVFQRGRKVSELKVPSNLNQPIKQILVFGSWVVGCATDRIEVWKTGTLEHYTTIYTMASSNGGNEITGGVRNMPTYLNKIFVGRKDGWVEIWNVSTGKLIYTVLPPSPKAGAVTCMEPTPALSLMAIAYSSGVLVVQNILTDKPVLAVKAGTEDAPVSTISFRTDGKGAGQIGDKDGVMATATTASGDITFWDLNKGGRIMSVLRGAHNPPLHDGKTVRGGIGKIEFLPGQHVILTSGLDNSLKSWIFDEAAFSPVPRVLHSRSGHAAPVTCLQFLPSDFDGADAGNKWLLSGGLDRSLWGWSLRRDGQSTELSQGNIRKKAKKQGILTNSALSQGPTTTLDDLKAPEITCIASSLNRDGGMGALPGKQPIWKNSRGKNADAETSSLTGWESVVTAHRNDSRARTWFWGRKKAGRWAFPTGDGSNVSTVAISPCGTFALVGSVEGSVDMYNLQSGQHRQRFPSKITPAQARQLKVQQLRQADDGLMQLEYNSKSGFLPGTGRHKKAVTGIVVDSMLKFVITCSLDGTVKFWDFLTGTLLDQMDWAPMTAITGCRYHPGSDLVAFSCDDNSIRIVDMETKKVIREFWGCQSGINDFCFSPDGRWIVAVSQDSVMRVWDLPTSHLIDAMRLEQACKAVCFSSTGEYLATAAEGQLGVDLWTNRTLFKHVPTRQISEKEIASIPGPTTSGEGGQGLIEAAFAEDEQDDDDAISAPSVDQLSAELMTLSMVPRAKWQTLLHLDLIKQRNKPKEAPKVPEKAPFFLPPVGDKSLAPVTNADKADESKSRITALDLSRSQEAFTAKLHRGAMSGNYNEFVEYLKSLSPSTADLELRSLSSGGGDDDEEGGLNELLHFIRALTARLVARRDYELMQAWMAVFLRLHSDQIIANDGLVEALQEWKAQEEKEKERLDKLVGYCGGVVGFLRSPLT